MMTAHFGEAYRAYEDRVGMLFPRSWHPAS